MALVCGPDPLVCIEFVVVGVGEFLKDWTTLAMMAMLLALLLKQRADQRKKREAAYARELLIYEEQRHHAKNGATWSIDDTPS